MGRRSVYYRFFRIYLSLVELYLPDWANTLGTGPVRAKKALARVAFVKKYLIR